MKDLIIVVLVLAVVIVIITILSFFGLRKISGLNNQIVISIVTLIINFIMIALMLLAIAANKNSTDTTINALQNEVTRQIDSYQKSTAQHIKTIKNSTEKYINEMRKNEKEKARASLLTLRKELELNRCVMKGYIDNKETYVKGDKLMVNSFNIAAYDQGIITDYLTVEKLINDILLLYKHWKAANRLMDMAINVNILPLSNKTKTIGKYNSIIIGICDKSEENCKEIIEDVIEAEKPFSRDDEEKGRQENKTRESDLDN